MEREKHQCARDTSLGCLLQAPTWGSGPQPRHVPWLGIKLATFWFLGRHWIPWATPAGAHFCSDCSCAPSTSAQHPTHQAPDGCSTTFLSLDCRSHHPVICTTKSILCAWSPAKASSQLPFHSLFYQESDLFCVLSTFYSPMSFHSSRTLVSARRIVVIT